MPSALQAMVDAVFGQSVVSVNDNGCDENPIGVALTKASTFPQHQANLSARLQRLQSAYQGHDSEADLHKTVAELGSPSNWPGALAELAPLNHFCPASSGYGQAPQLNVDLPAADPVAGDVGKTVANLDLLLESAGIYSDVKVLKDNVTEILSGVIHRLGALAPPVWHVEYTSDSGYDNIKSSLASIEHKVKAATNCGKQPVEVDCTDVIAGLKLRFLWDAGVLLTQTTFHPYRHARATAELPVIHAKKFVKIAPFFLTFVVHPWFNNVVPPTECANLQYYRAMARRSFLDAARLNRPFKTAHAAYTGAGTVGDFLEHLGGILFLEDRSLNGTDPSEANVRAYYYENPRAQRKPSARELFREFLNDAGLEVFDDFQYDDY